MPALRPKRALILGGGQLASDLIREIGRSPGCGYTLAGILADAGVPTGAVGRLPVFRSLDDLQTVIDGVRPDCIIVALSERRGRLPIHELVAARVHGRISVLDGEEVYERLTGKIAIELLTPSTVIFSHDFRPTRTAASIARLVSVVVAAVGLVCLLPLLAAIALLIKFDSRGPVLFVQERIGLRGRRFRLLKFRTMHPSANRMSEWVRDNGDRITRAGRWLRRFRLDELPQFINVLKGDMNIIGPRPHPVSNWELFVLVSRNTPACGEQIPYYSLRSLVRPGITGWAQVRYQYANDLDEEIEKMRYDLYYIKHLSLLLDLRILLETIKVVTLGRERVEAEEEEHPAAPRPPVMADFATTVPRPPRRAVS